MLSVRPSAERLHTKIGWLDSRHTFSFGEHIDPRYMGFRALRVINDDRVAPAMCLFRDPQELPAVVFPELDMKVFALNLELFRLNDIIHSRSPECNVQS